MIDFENVWVISDHVYCVGNACVEIHFMQNFLTCCQLVDTSGQQVLQRTTTTRHSNDKCEDLINNQGLEWNKITIYKDCFMKLLSWQQPAPRTQNQNKNKRRTLDRFQDTDKMQTPQAF